MKYYSITEAIIFLAQEYGAENMPTSEETLRRAIRTKKLLVQEDGEPGRKGYTIAEKDLRDYAESRIKRIQLRNDEKKENRILNANGIDLKSSPPVYFLDLYGQYTDGRITNGVYYKELLQEKMKWEQLMYEKKEQLAKLTAQCKRLENDIESCQNAIESYNIGIAKL